MKTFYTIRAVQKPTTRTAPDYHRFRPHPPSFGGRGDAQLFVAVLSLAFDRAGRCEMPFVIAAPDLIASAASDLAGVRSVISEANAAAAPSTTAVATAAGDEVSAVIASLFSAHGQQFQALSNQAAVFHTELCGRPSGAGNAYAAMEAANSAAIAGRAAGRAGGGELADRGAAGASADRQRHQRRDGHRPGRRCRRILWGNGGNGGIRGTRASRRQRR